MDEQEYRKYRVHMTVRGGMGMEWYKGHVDVWAYDPDGASERAKQELRRTTFPERSYNLFQADSVELLP